MSKVVIKECKDYNLENIIEKLNSGIELIGGWESFVSPGMKVLLKVNLIGPKTPDSAAVTHSEFVRALTKILKEKGCTVWIGDSAGGAIGGIAPTKHSFIVSGLEKVAIDEGAEIKNFDKEGVVEVKLQNGKSMHIAKPMFDADLVINLPKLKTHMSAVYTGAVKNVFGCIPGLKKAEYHKIAPSPKEFAKVIADINSSIKIGLHIMDGIIAMDGEGPTAGGVYQAHKMLISKDPVALDIVASKMIGLDIEDVPILLAARDRELGEGNLKNIELVGDYKEIPILKGYKLPNRLKKVSNNNYKLLSKLIDFLKVRPRVNQKVCKKCNMCVESCPVGAIDKETKYIDYTKCIECMCCHELCMHKAIELKQDNPLAGAIMKIAGRKYR